jgi:hypothetical protein
MGVFDREGGDLDLSREPCGRDPVRWATQVALLVLLSPALLVVLLVGVLGVGVVAVERMLGWSMRQVRAGTGAIATGPIPRRPGGLTLARGLDPGATGPARAGSRGRTSRASATLPAAPRSPLFRKNGPPRRKK